MCLPYLQFRTELQFANLQYERQPTKHVAAQFSKACYFPRSFPRSFTIQKNRVSHMLNNWVDGVSDEAYYPWESPKKIRLKSVNPTFASEQKKVSIHQ